MKVFKILVLVYCLANLTSAIAGEKVFERYEQFVDGKSVGKWYFKLGGKTYEPCNRDQLPKQLKWKKHHKEDIPHSNHKVKRIYYRCKVKESDLNPALQSLKFRYKSAAEKEQRLFLKRNLGPNNKKYYECVKRKVSTDGWKEVKKSKIPEDVNWKKYKEPYRFRQSKYCVVKESSLKPKYQSESYKTRIALETKAQEAKAKKEAEDKLIADEIAKAVKDCEELQALRDESKDEEIASLKGIIHHLCFPAETLIAVSNDNSDEYSFVPICSIQLGDSVVSCDLNEDEQENENQEVQFVFESKSDRLIKIGFNDRTVRATPNHPFFVVNANDWVEASNLKIGDELQDVSGEKVFIETLDEEVGDFEVYNLDVKRNHNYYAEGVLVHNCSKIGITPPPGY